MEGIYVRPGFRRRGISRQLIRHGEAWVKAQGCSQIASDIEQTNDVSYSFHMKVGFREANRIICFIKEID